MDRSPITGPPRPTAPAPSDNVLVGVAGWSYPDWHGCFYPAKRQALPELALVCRTFDCAEINVSFYRIPEARMAEHWLRAVAWKPGFLFTSKVPKELTHEKDIDATGIGAAGADLKEGLRPLIEAGRLAAFLLQFPFHFCDGPESRDRIRRLLEALQPVPVAVEVRHRSFYFGPLRSSATEQSPLYTGPGNALHFLEKLGAAFVNIDLPPGAGSVPPTSINTSPLGYVRLHGRNARAWFDPKATRDEKYDYRYGPEELAQWKERILKLAARTGRTFVIANNHFKAQAPANAIELMHLLGRTPAQVPREIIQAFPELGRLVRPAEAVAVEKSILDLPGVSVDPSDQEDPVPPLPRKKGGRR